MSINQSEKYLVVSAGRMPGDLNDWDCAVVAPGEPIPELAQNCPRPDELIWSGSWEKPSKEEAEAFKAYRLGEES